MITLRDITEENFRECIQLSVKEEQKGFVAPNVRSLAQAWLHYDYAHPYAIYNDETMIGFVMLGYGADDSECFLWRYMIDQRYQNQGLGKRAMDAVMEHIKAREQFTGIALSYEPENHVADKLYRSFGFMPTGKMIDGEIAMSLDIASN